jgi:replicative DNA helicase
MKEITKEEIENWKAPEVASRVISSDDFVSDLIEMSREKPEDYDGVMTKHWPVFNEAFGGARPEEVIVVTGETGTGKSTWCFAWMIEMLYSNTNTFLVSLEMSRKATVRKLSSMICGSDSRYFDDTARSFAMSEFQKLPLFYLDTTEFQKDTFLFKAIQFACFECGCRFVLIDHLEFIEKSSKQGQDEAILIRNFMLGLADVAKKTKATIVLIVHPAKLHVFGMHNREINMDELKGSSSIKQIAHAVFSIFRTNPETGEMIVRFWKIRNDNTARNRMSFVRFTFSQKQFKFTETSMGIEWGEKP